MRCSKCNGKTYVVDSRQILKEHERYRRRRCVKCGEIMYTTEIEVEYDKIYAKNWLENCKLTEKKGEKDDKN